MLLNEILVICCLLKLDDNKLIKVRIGYVCKLMNLYGFVLVD